MAVLTVVVTIISIFILGWVVRGMYDQYITYDDIEEGVDEFTETDLQRTFVTYDLRKKD